MDIPEVISEIFIILLGLYVLVVDLVFAITQKQDKFRNIKFWYVATGAYWIIFYALIVLTDIPWFIALGKYFVRLGVTLTLFSLSLGATARAVMAGVFTRIRDWLRGAK